MSTCPIQNSMSLLVWISLDASTLQAPAPSTECEAYWGGQMSPELTQG